MSIKNDTEKSIFEHIYSATDFNYLHKDKPDFWVKTNVNSQFGVEITELFRNESSARISKIETYLEELIDERKFRHKNDKENIVIEQIQFLNKNDELITQKEALIEKIPQFEFFLNLLSECIQEKNEKFKNYNSELEYCNLIINDHTSTLSFIKSDQILRWILNSEFQKVLTNSPFEEIYLITIIDNKKKFLSLKQGLFLYHTYIFQELINSIHDYGEPLDENYYYSFLVEYLYLERFQNLRINNDIEKKSLEVVYALTGYSLTQTTVKVKLYDGWSKSHFQKAIEEHKYIDPKIESLIKNIKSKYAFEGDLSREINSSQNT